MRTEPRSRCQALALGELTPVQTGVGAEEPKLSWRGGAGSSVRSPDAGTSGDAKDEGEVAGLRVLFALRLWD